MTDKNNYEETEATNIEETEATIEDLPVEEVSPVSNGGLSFRYVCPACTNVAYYANDILVDHLRGTCQNCGSNLGAIQTENFIALTPEQKQALIDQGL